MTSPLPFLLCAVILSVSNGVISRLGGAVAGFNEASYQPQSARLVWLSSPGQIAVHPRTYDVLVPLGRGGVVYSISSATGDATMILSSAAYSGTLGQTLNVSLLAVAVSASTEDIFVASGTTVWRALANGTAVYVLAGAPRTQCRFPPTPLPQLCIYVNSIAVAQDVNAVLVAGYWDVSPIIRLNQVVAIDGGVGPGTNASAEVWAGVGRAPIQRGDGGPATLASIRSFGSQSGSLSVLPNGDTLLVDNGAIRVIVATTGVISPYLAGGSQPFVNAMVAHPSTGDITVLDYTTSLCDSGGGIFTVDARGNAQTRALTCNAPLHPAASIFSLAYNPSTLDLFFTATVLLADDDVSSVASVFVIPNSTNAPVLIAGGNSPWVCANTTCRPGTSFGSGFIVNGSTLIISDSSTHAIYSLDVLAWRTPSYAPALGIIAGGSCPGGGYSGDNGPALGSCLRGPTALALAADGSLVFIDQRRTVIRRVSAGTGLIDTLHSQRCGGSACSYRGLTVDRAGNVLVSESTGPALFVLVTSPQVSCPVGYACPAGAPILCGPTSFCPGNTWTSLTPNIRHTLSSPIRTASGVIVYTAQVRTGERGHRLSSPTLPPLPHCTWVQEVCPVGAYCADGVQTDCPAGTLGLISGAHSAADCEPCPPDTYSSLAGAAAERCLPCPHGTSLPLNATGASQCVWCAAGTSRGGASGSVCEPCLRGSYSLGGPTGCVVTSPGLTLLLWDSFSSLVALSQGASDAASVSATGIAEARVADPGTIVAVALAALALVPLLAIIVRPVHPRVVAALRSADSFGCVRWEVWRVSVTGRTGPSGRTGPKPFVAANHRRLSAGFTPRQRTAIRLSSTARFLVARAHSLLQALSPPSWPSSCPHTSSRRLSCRSLSLSPLHSRMHRCPPPRRTR